MADARGGGEAQGRGARYRFRRTAAFWFRQRGGRERFGEGEGAEQEQEQEPEPPAPESALAAWTVTAVVVFMHVGSLAGMCRAAPLPVLAVCSALLIVLPLLSIPLLDYALLRLIMTDFTALVRMVASVVAAVTLAAVLGFDDRSMVAPGIVTAMFGQVMLDAMPLYQQPSSSIHNLVSYVSVTLWITSIATLLNLGRFPGTQDVAIDVGTLGGLAAQPMASSAQQLCSSSIFVLIVLGLETVRDGVWWHMRGRRRHASKLLMHQTRLSVSLMVRQPQARPLAQPPSGP